MTNADLEKIVDTTDEWIKTRTGIEERHIADKDEATSDMAVKAAHLALKDAKVSAADLDLIIVATVTPDNLFPPTACLVQHQIKATKAAAFDLEAACPGFVYGLTIATQFIQAGFYKTILIIGAEKLSAITNWKDRSTCVLLGDGAGAVVVQAVAGNNGILSCYLAADGAGGEFLQMPGGGSRHPATVETVEKGMHFLQMNGREVYKMAAKVMVEGIHSVVQRGGYAIGDLQWIFPHQANIRIIEALAEKIDIPKERIYINIQKYGNTSAASIPLALDEAYQQGKLKPGDLITLVSFGSGFVWGAVLLRWCKPVHRS